jgi:hypothetical protein
MLIFLTKIKIKQKNLQNSEGLNYYILKESFL